MFKALGAIVQAAKDPAQSVVISEPPPKSAISESVMTSPPVTMVGSSPEADAGLSAQEEVHSARTREWRSKLNQDDAARVAASTKDHDVVEESSGAEHPAPRQHRCWEIFCLRQQSQD